MNRVVIFSGMHIIVPIVISYMITVTLLSHHMLLDVLFWTV